MFNRCLNFRAFIRIFIWCGFLTAVDAPGVPIRLTVQPKGTNQIEVVFGPVVPGVFYNVLARTNGPDGHWVTFARGFLAPSNGLVRATCELSAGGDPPSPTVQTLKNWKFVAGRWDDNYGDELPFLYKELVLRTDPYASGDAYANPMGDGWCNIQKFQSNKDPYRAYLPAQPHANVSFQGWPPPSTNRFGKAILTIDVSGAMPDYIEIERAPKILRPQTNALPSGPPPRFFTPPTNRPLLTNRMFSTNRMALTNRTTLTNRPGFANRMGYTNRMFSTNRMGYAQRNLTTNRPPPRSNFYRSPFGPREDPFVTGPYKTIARIITKPGVNRYTFVDTNIDLFLQPEYRTKAHFTSPLRSELTQLNAEIIRKRQLQVRVDPKPGGYALTAVDPIPYGRYLLLVRDRRDPQWRASGYFEAGTNQAVHLNVDSRGMMSEGQSPLAMPRLKFLPNLVEPQFTAGWGEDSDGDGLPDIYEVLVSGTDPINADTDNTGILDGYKEMSNDGWSTLEKFRRRMNPVKTVGAPETQILKQPTMAEAMMSAQPRSDLPYEPEVSVRVVGATEFHPVREGLWMLYQLSDPHDPGNVRGNFDLRVLWTIPTPKPHDNYGYHGP